MKKSPYVLSAVIALTIYHKEVENNSTINQIQLLEVRINRNGEYLFGGRICTIFEKSYFVG